MNKYIKALDVYKRLESFKQGVIIPCDPMKFYKAEKTLQELVDKATPKKPRFVSEIGWFCTRCHCGLYIGQKFCDECGQEIDWSDEND